MSVDKELLVKLTETNGIAGNEGQIRQLFKAETLQQLLQFQLLTISSKSVFNE